MGNRVLTYGDRSLDLGEPKVMGILNITPDSFFDGGNYVTEDDQLRQVEKMLAEGAAVIDVGAVSTRPGAKPVSEEEERKRLIPAVKAILRRFPDCLLSVDTWRPGIAGEAIGNGAWMINDISGGTFDPRILELAASHKIPYVMMHIRGTPETMQVNPEYGDVVAEIMDFFRQQLSLLPPGYRQVILDPGFGFGKTDLHNFTLLSRLGEFRSMGFPVMAGLSRKSMINRTLKTAPEDALNGTTVLNTVALLKGADILRVHDVREAAEAIRLVSMLKE
jgi:dihydropteroate synthase